MNADTVNLIERPYQEIVDDILTAVVGGVVNEPIAFDVKFDVYPLAQPAQAVRSITGTVEAPDRPEGLHYTFQVGVDFLFDPAKNAVVWQAGGRKPKDETTFFADYSRLNSRSPLSDINVGSVTRTLSEAIGREIATVYQQINLAYLSGFIDTATGKALDLVVKILGVTRKTKEFAVGLVTFFRDAAVEGNITIPQGTELATAKGEVLFVTTEPRALQRGQIRIDVPIRAGDKFSGEIGQVEAGKITVLSQLIAGIAQVSNFEPTIRAAEDESDDELRLRAKAALRGLGNATIAALIRTVFENRAKVNEVSDPNTLGGKQTAPGTVVMRVDIEPARFPSLAAAINDTRAAGVQVTIAAPFVFITPRIAATISPGLAADGQAKIASDIIAALEKYVDGLGSGASAKGQDLLAAIKSVKDVKDCSIVDVRASRADVGQPGAGALVETLVAAVANVDKSDTDALRTALAQVLSSDGPAFLPSGRRVPDRDVVQSLNASGKLAGGKRASDGEIKASKFVVVPGDQFALVLDMSPADIVLEES